MKKKALIIGISGQDGSLLAKHLLKKNYLVHGILRNSYKNLKILKILQEIKIHKLKIISEKKLNLILKKNFDEIYFLGGQSSVIKSYKKIYETYSSQLEPVRIILNFIHKQKKKKSKFLFAGSSEIFGDINGKNSLTLDSKKKPKSPYGLSKLICFEMIKSYREMFKLPVYTVIMFNHESNLRPNSFIIKKIINYLKKISTNKVKSKLSIGNTKIKRDWGWAAEYMEGCHKIINSKKISDYIIATGKTVSLENLIDYSFKRFGLNWKKYIYVDKKKIRKFDINENNANIGKIKKEIKWAPKINYKKVINQMLLNE